MARKDLMKGLMGGVEPQKPTSPARPAAYTKGAVGAVSRSINELKSRAILEVPADLIDDDGGLRDRLEHSAEDHAALVQSLRDYGQQVPVLLRHHANLEGRYQIVYGRRRVAALKSLGQPVKALLREMDDRELILAQGQENSARRDLTFVEKANFARQMRDAGFDRKLICDALHIDKTLISRMLTVADTVTPDLITAIGPAPGIGRDRWLLLARHIEARGGPVGELVAEARQMSDHPSDARFEAILAALAPRAPAPSSMPGPRALAGDLGTVAAKGKSVAITLGDADFGQWLADNISEIHRQYRDTTGGE
ncbi:MAG: plasmid partitioning protein RepB [Pseudomonadota bacterium]